MGKVLEKEIIKNLEKMNYQILSEQKKEYYRLKEISNFLELKDLEEDRLRFKTNNIQSLINNENYLWEFSNKIRELWRLKCFNHSNRYLSSPLLGDSQMPLSTLNNRQIESTYERYFTNSSLNSRNIGKFISFNTLTSSGMAAIKLCFEMLNSLFVNEKKKILYSVGYYETLFLLNSLAKTGVDCEDLSNRYVKNEDFNIFILEPHKADLTLKEYDSSVVEKYAELNPHKLKVVILDISYQGLSFNLDDFVSKFSRFNVIIFVVRSLVKLDQVGLEFANGGMVEVFIPDHLAKLKNFLEKEINKFRNAHGSNLSFYEFSLLDNNITLPYIYEYSRLVLSTTEDFYIDLKSNFEDTSRFEILSKSGVPFIYLDLKKTKDGYEEFLNVLQEYFKTTGTFLPVRNSFGFRNLSVEYFGIIETEKYVFKICPGIFKGVNYYLLISFLKIFLSKREN